MESEMISQKSTANASPWTIRSIPQLDHARHASRSGKGMRRWLGDTPIAPVPIGTIFGNLRTRSSTILRKTSGKQCVLVLECECLHCGRVVFPRWHNLARGTSTQCSSCARRRLRNRVIASHWGRKPDGFDKNVYKRWSQIKSRCENPNDPAYHNYGGRGIILHSDFKNGYRFVDYVKALPEADLNKEIGRIDNERGYEPGNLRWETKASNARNTRRTRSIEWEGDTYCLEDWAREFTALTPYRVGCLLRGGLTPAEVVARGRKKGAPGLRPRKRWTKTQVCDG